MSSLSVVIPVYCEGRHLEHSLQEIARHVQSVEADYELLVVDDGSTDDTWDVIAAYAERDTRCRALRLSRNFGKEAAVFSGLEQATGSAVIVMDADLQHPPQLIPAMVQLWKEGTCDVVDAVKESRGTESHLRKLTAALFNYIMCSMSGFDLANSSDFKLLDRKVVDALLRLPERRTFYRGMVEWLGFRHVRLPMQVEPRVGGVSTWSFLHLVRLAAVALTSFSTIALHGITALGCIFLVPAVILGIGSLYRWFSGTALAGFSTVIVLQLFVGSVVMLALGIIGEYLAGIYQEVKRRPRYIISETRGRGADS